MNKKIKRLAMFSALSSKVAGSEMVVIDAISATEYKTSAMAKMLAAVNAGKKALVVLPEVDAKVIASLRNIEGVKVAQYNTINVYDILNCNTLVCAKAAIEKIEEVYA
jgi:large subunit ribosomal protein L4